MILYSEMAEKERIDKKKSGKIITYKEVESLDGNPSSKCQLIQFPKTIQCVNTSEHLRTVSLFDKSTLAQEL